MPSALVLSLSVLKGRPSACLSVFVADREAIFLPRVAVSFTACCCEISWTPFHSADRAHAAAVQPLVRAPGQVEHRFRGCRAPARGQVGSSLGPWKSAPRLVGAAFQGPRWGRRSGRELRPAVLDPAGTSARVGRNTQSRRRSCAWTGPTSRQARVSRGARRAPELRPACPRPRCSPSVPPTPHCRTRSGVVAGAALGAPPVPGPAVNGGAARATRSCPLHGSRRMRVRTDESCLRPGRSRG